MFKFIKPKGPHLTAERQKLQKELFAYRRTLQHGFPHKPTALAWDGTLRLLCVGTATGAVKVFGKPGVEFYGQHQNPIAVIQLAFIPNVGRVVSLCEDNSLHLWEVDKSSLVQVRSQALEGKLKKISAICVDAAGKHLLLGTEGGNIYILDLHTFSLTPDIIYQDVVMQSAPPDFKLNPGAVESVVQRPSTDDTDHILIGYNRGLIVLWDCSTSAVVKTYTPAQQLESVSWHDDGEGFTSTHNDGSYIIWTVDCEDGKPQGSNTNATYGPFACKATLKLIRKDLKGKPLITFSGGLPRSNYGDKFSVTVLHDDRHVVFDFSSKIVDFIIVDASPSEESNDTDEASDNDSTTSQVAASVPEALIVLAEEELVAIDLQCEDWKMINLPYMVSLHASAVTCSHHVQGVPEDLWEQLKKAGQSQSQTLYSNHAWPVDGGDLLCSKGAPPRRELLLTGHEDGTVRFWDAGGVTLTPVYKFSTAQFFTGDDLDDTEPSPDDEDEWPPFRKTGIFDPYSDDPRLAVKRVTLCPLSGTLVVAGTAGHIIVAKFDTEVLDGEINVTTMNIVSDRDGFVWKGHSQLTPRTGDVHQARGFQLQSLLQLYPPAAVTCCVLQADWGLVAAGTAHGLALYDYVKHKPVIVKCTLNPNDLTGAGDAPISRRKSFKKSLRESFRRLRKGRSQRGRSDATTTKNPTSGGGVISPPGRKLPPSGGDADNLESKPVERQIEARATDDSMGSFVRCLYFARTFLISVQNTVPTLWAGTNSGTVLVFTITIPHRPQTSQPTPPASIPTTQCQLAKEIQLKHRAPVIAIAVLDGSHRPLPEALEVERGVAPLPDTTQSHRVVIASEEQFKVFQLPSLKAWGKYKLTAHEGARIRRMNFANFTCNSLDGTNTPYSEIDLLCLTNLGDCLVLSIPDLKRQLNAAAVKKEDINGISSLIFTKDAEALYMHSSSELQRLSLAAQHLTSARCYLSLKEGCRDNNVTSENEKDTADLKETEATEQDESAVTGDTKEEKSNRASGGESLVNGGSSADNIAETDKNNDSSIKENGDDTLHSLHNSTVTSSIGDITIDSVKEHLSTSTAAAITAANVNAHNEQEINARLSSLTVTKTQVTNIVSTVTTNNGQTETQTNSSTVVTSGGGGGATAAAVAAPSTDEP